MCDTPRYARTSTVKYKFWARYFSIFAGYKRQMHLTCSLFPPTFSLIPERADCPLPPSSPGPTLCFCRMQLPFLLACPTFAHSSSHDCPERAAHFLGKRERGGRALNRAKACSRPTLRKSGKASRRKFLRQNTIASCKMRRLIPCLVMTMNP